MDLLPVNGAALAADARALAAVQAISTRHGFDYTDDAAVTVLLTERRQALTAEQRRPAATLGVLALTAGLLLPCAVPIVPALTDHLFAALGAAGCLFVVGVAMVVHVRVRWKRALTDGPLAGYREVLGVARAHGIPLTHVPAWLEGRSSTGGGKGAVPIPTYAAVEPLPDQAPPDEPLPGTAPPGAGPCRAADAPATAPVTVPPKPEAVSAYETMADVGGWHDETGCLLILGGACGAMWAATSDEPGAYGALLLVPLAVYIWLVGRRQGREKERLREAALAYVREVAAAQAAGAKVPELSPKLRELTESQHD
ncbi:hypothetical protein [Streptomyces sp. M92]|uniref:hypothetical protein n=1 Tax=Streptomyces sp. M92 TaxID=2944250 RepID=UPI00234B03AD|nr:hypothetical protein [Streptomyces sp. M92]WCN02573.1 hypothetical protein M6G08_11060 [Streptomyces sp. M92]